MAGLIVVLPSTWLAFWLGLLGEQGGREETEHLTLASAFDHFYITGVRGCEHRAEIVRKYAEDAGFLPFIFFGVHFEDFTLDNPPIPIRDIPPNQKVRAGQVACFATHRMIWQDVIKNSYSTVMILEDDVFFTKQVLEYLPELMSEVNAAGREKGIDWHIMYFRRAALRPTDTEKIWSNSPSGHPITYACPSLETSSYAMTGAGAQFLHNNVDHYQYPLDVQISKLHLKDPAFVALSACHNNAYRHGCPENIFGLSDEQKAPCAASGTRAGQAWTADKFPRAEA